MRLLFVAILLVVCFEMVSCVIHGEVSKPGQWPFMAMIFDNIGFLKCAGVVWNDRTILTAAACLCNKRVSQKYYVYLGYLEHFGSRLDENYVFDIEKEVYFNTKSDGTCDGDSENIALLKLNSTIDFNGVHSKVRCAGVPFPPIAVDQNLCISVGFSGASIQFPPIYRHVKTSIRDHQSCAHTYRFYNANRHICAGDSNGKVVSMDLGGPLMCPIKEYPNQYKLVAISNVFTQEKEFYSNNDPSIYCVIDYYYYDWILKNAGGICAHIH